MLHGFDFLRQQYSQLAKPSGGNQSAIAAVQTLTDRLLEADQNNASIEDRRAAVLALKGLSRDHTRYVGEKALPALLSSLQRDSHDEETARALVECCLILCEVQPSNLTENAPHSKHKHESRLLGLRNSDVFLAEPGPLHALLPLLSPNRAFYTRFASLQLLGSLLRNQPSRVQDHVLVAPGGCGAILECLAEGAGSSAEIVRNEALFLLPHLVFGNADIQKLVAFEGAFEKLLDVCAAEGRVEGGVIVQDALEGLESLLRYNVSNQNYFRETLSIPMLAPLLFYPPPPPASGGFPSRQAEQEYTRQLEAFSFQDWDQQKQVNAKLVIGIAGMLVSGQGEGRKANQIAMLQCGLTKCLLELGLASTAPTSLKSQALHVSASLLRASRQNQDQLSALLVSPVQQVPSEPNEQLDPNLVSQRPSSDLARSQLEAEPTFTRLPARPAVLTLIGTAVLRAEDKSGGLGLRAAALACFEAYVADNLDARLAILNTMAPPDDNPNVQNHGDQPVSAGSLLLDGLNQSPTLQAASGEADAYKFLFSSILFAHLVRGSETAKKTAREIAVTPDGKTVKRAPKVSNGEDDDDDDDDDDDGTASLIQVIVGNLTLAERELSDAVRRERAGMLGSVSNSTSASSLSAADWTRIMTGYLQLLSIWLFDSPLSVRDFLSESATLQALIQPVAQSSGVDPLIQGLAAFLIGIAYEFDSDPGNVAVTRSTMHPILHSRIGADQFAVRLARVSDDIRFRQVGPDVLEKLAKIDEELEAQELKARQAAEAAAAALSSHASVVKVAGAATTLHSSSIDQHTAEEENNKEKADEEARDRDLELNRLGHFSRRRTTGLWFDWNFVEFWKNHSVLIQKSMLVDPLSTSASQAAASTELLDAQRQVESLRDTITRQSREIETLEKRLEEGKVLQETRVSNLEAELVSLRESQSIAAIEKQEEKETEAPYLSRISLLESQVFEKQSQLSLFESQFEKLQSESTLTQTELQTTLSIQAQQLSIERQQIQQLQQTLSEMVSRKNDQDTMIQLGKQNEELSKENEDLLVLLEELTQKRKRDKQVLREKGFDVSDDEEEEEVGNQDD